MKKNRRTLTKTLIIIFSVIILLLLWQFVSMILDSQILMPGVNDVLLRFFELFASDNFIYDVLSTIIRAFESFLIIVILATILGTLAGKYKVLGWFITPILTVLKTTPVMSVILLAFIWFETGTVPVFSAFLMGFPIMYMMMEGAVEQLELEMDQMCYLYGFSTVQKLKYYIIPTLAKSFSLGARQTLSMVWKVVVAAEVLTIPKFGVGAKMQFAQIQLETAEVFSWTLIAILLSAIGDLIFNLIESSIKKVSRYLKEKNAL
ncbi:MAG: ABC transporter permease [Pleomorphochaeta sp.]